MRALRFLAAAFFAVFFALNAASATGTAASQGDSGAALPASVYRGAYAEGERLFRENKPGEAAPLLEQAILEPGADERAWIYLGLSYQQLGRLDQAAAVLRKGAATALRFKHLFYFDLGNVFVLQGKNSFAAEMFGEAIAADGSYAPAYLNRANSNLSTRSFEAALSDYRRYLELDPGSFQRDAIAEIAMRLDAAIAEEKRLRAEAQAKIDAEIAARKALIDQVAASLKAAADETTSLSAGSGSVQGYGDELTIDE